MRGTFLFSPDVSQETWAQSFASVASVIVNTGDASLSIFEKMEQDGVVLTAGLLRSCFEGMVVKDDQVATFREMDEHKKQKLTASLLKEVTTTLKDKRHWRWLLMHSAMPEDKVHPSRSVFSSLQWLS